MAHPSRGFDEARRRAREHATTPASRARREALDPVFEGMLTGDFASAIAAFPVLEAFLARQTRDSLVEDCVGLESDVYEAAGSNDWPADVAEANWKRRPTLTLDDPTDHGSWVLRILHVTGRISAAEFRAGRELRAKEDAARRPPRLANLAWLHFFAATLVTPTDAREALEALPRYSPLPSFDGDVYYERVMGQVPLLAGRVDEAIPHLRRAVNACVSLNYIQPHRDRRRAARRSP